MRRAIAAVGRSLVTVGLLILLFVAYQLWGTGIFTARAQSDLEDELAALREQVRGAPTTTTSTGEPPSSTSSTVPGSTTTTTPVVVDLPEIGSGDPLGKIAIPRIGLDWVFVQGTAREDLKKGPGHYPTTPLPGQIGNAAIAGHRTTYGAPFNRLDELEVGDAIVTETFLGRYEYEVKEKFVVRPTDVWVADNTTDAQLTLTTCNPKYSARERLVIKAALVVERSDAPSDVVVRPPRDLEDHENAVLDGLEGDPSSRTPAILWGIATLVVGLLWWWLFRHWRHPLTWLAGMVPFAGVLFFFYVYLERLLPAGY